MVATGCAVPWSSGIVFTGVTEPHITAVPGVPGSGVARWSSVGSVDIMGPSVLVSVVLRLLKLCIK